MKAPPSSARRLEAWRRGRRSEALAAWLLRLKGYRILARDLRLPGGEIDILAARGRTLAVIEVKRRAGAAAAAEALQPRQRGRILRAARLYIAGRPELARHRVRFDVILFDGGLLPRHLAGAWQDDAGAAGSF
ncbi:MAG: YraN family protein [Rhodospirillaceae bacterium]|nr:YraN family protein [Rhodospirillaceae bacterium]